MIEQMRLVLEYANTVKDAIQAAIDARPLSGTEREEDVRSMLDHLGHATWRAERLVKYGTVKKAKE